MLDLDVSPVQKDLRFYQSTVEAISQNSPGAKVFVLLHKMDLVPEAEREAFVADRKAGVSARTPAGLAHHVHVFATSIWDETLYKAWSTVVHSLIPNIGALEEQLRGLARACDADEAVLFERATFLVISAATLKPHADIHRFEKISNIVKQFKLSCS
jgi:Ras-related GTP-binding protein A/B